MTVPYGFRVPVTCRRCGNVIAGQFRTHGEPLTHVSCDNCSQPSFEPWIYDEREGTYTRNGDEDYEQEEEQHENYPARACQGCGGIQFSLMVQQVVTRTFVISIDSDGSEDFLEMYFEDNVMREQISAVSDTRIVNPRLPTCSNCGLAWHGDWELDGEYHES